jgi:hypothetical protein
MRKILYIILAFVLGIICAGCACPPKGQLTIVAKSVQSIEKQPVEFEVQYILEK